MFLKPEDLKKRFRATVSDEVIQKIAKPRYNLAPTQDVPIITNTNGERIAEMVRWGLIPSWAKDETIASKLINARAETLLEKPSFKNAFQKRRCLVVANGFYEWKSSVPNNGNSISGVKKTSRSNVKQPMYVRLKSQEPFAMAGLWEEWKNPATREPIKTCTIITTEPNDLIATLHHRMAVILSPSDEDLWLDDSIPTRDLMELLKPFPSDALEVYPVSTRINAVSADEPSMIDRIELLSVARNDEAEQASLFGI